MKSQRGFSLVELLVVITIIGILASLALANMTRVRHKARESEVKANLHVIQEAVERYQLDEGEYPAFLVGGDQNSWEVFFVRKGYTDLTDPVIYDPLIRYNYLDSYPLNPFVDPQTGGLYLEQSGGDKFEPASGDPRFGMKGTIMPNSVDDYLWFPTEPDVQCPTLNTETGSEPRIVNYGAYGGYRVPSGDTDRYIIAGSFFYRAEGPIDMISSTPSSGEATRRDFVYQNYSRYILGGFGHETTKGLDVIRLSGAGDYRHQPDVPPANFPYDIPLLFPEVFGGGDGDNNPYFPYEPSQDGVPFPYGAPDGLEDGIILVVTDSGTSLNF